MTSIPTTTDDRISIDDRIYTKEEISKMSPVEWSPASPIMFVLSETILRTILFSVWVQACTTDSKKASINLETNDNENEYTYTVLEMESKRTKRIMDRIICDLCQGKTTIDIRQYIQEL